MSGIFEQNTTTDNDSPYGQEEFEAVVENQEEEVYEDAEQDTAEPEVELTEEGNEDPEGQSEELFWGKFKSADDAKTAYENLQREFTKMRMSQKTPEQTPQQPIQQQQEDQIDMSDPASIIDAINRDPAGTIAKIAQTAFQQARTIESQEQQFERAMDEVVDTYKDQLQSDADFQTYYSKIAKISRELGTDPKRPSARVVKMAAQELWGDLRVQSTTKVYNQAKEAVRKEFVEQRKQKQGLGAPTGAKPKETPKTPDEIYADSIVASGRKSGIFG